jgi:hypothetical protein
MLAGSCEGNVLNIHISKYPNVNNGEENKKIQSEGMNDYNNLVGTLKRLGQLVPWICMQKAENNKVKGI